LLSELYKGLSILWALNGWLSLRNIRGDSLSSLRRNILFTKNILRKGNMLRSKVNLKKSKQYEFFKDSRESAILDAWGMSSLLES
jgi:hypothetical protein